MKNCKDKRINPHINGECGDNVTYELDKVTGVLTISGKGSIGDSAFNNCSSLTKVKMNSVTSIGECAFHNCSSLTTVEMKSVETIGNYAFYGCTSITNITIPNSVKSIGYHVFGNCTSLTSITIPDSVTTLGDIDGDVFKDCTELKSITAPYGLKNNQSIIKAKKKGAMVTWN